jgi:hypothetical protein
MERFCAERRPENNMKTMNFIADPLVASMVLVVPHGVRMFSKVEVA